ncbi:TIGR03067 domain-containing protein [Lignipirellula cremea]|uniref:TIGR03067 domain-containing protein n=1 Tax=Lignipirellula cremea TaxID=2528010 RepID=A0A518E279_9BACT|nr:TIGR03067 domain-containing protein [Lignipirellula cremea]QDU98198.1 hypothetical protein Pla8534_60590 [Lignipirellula cremea]
MSVRLFHALAPLLLLLLLSPLATAADPETPATETPATETPATTTTEADTAAGDEDSPPEPEPRQEAEKAEQPSLIGKWQVVSIVEGGKEQEKKDEAVEFTKDQFLLGGAEKSPFSYLVRPDASPAELDLVFETPGIRVKLLGIYEIQNDTLRLCLAGPDNKRPTEFASPEGSPYSLATLQRKGP